MKIHLFRNHTVNELQMIPKGLEDNRRTADTTEDIGGRTPHDGVL